MDLTLDSFRNLFNTGKDGTLSTTSVEDTKGYVTVAVGEGGARSIANTGRTWLARSARQKRADDALEANNLEIKTSFIEALKKEGATEQFITDVRVMLGIDAAGAAVNQEGGKVLLRRTIKQVLRDFDKGLVKDSMKQSMDQAHKDFKEDADLRNKGVKSGGMAMFAALAQRLFLGNVAYGDSARIYFGEAKPQPQLPQELEDEEVPAPQPPPPPPAPRTDRQKVEEDLQVRSDDNLGRFARAGLANKENAVVVKLSKVIGADKEAIATIFTAFHHKIESGLGFRALGRSAAEKIENNRVRAMFLAAVIEELEARGLKGVDFENMPEEIKSVLKLSDFGESVRRVGNKVRVEHASGKPLTARRVLEVMEAINQIFGSQQNVSKAGRESTVIGMLTGRLDPSQSRSISSSRMSRGVQSLLERLRSYLGAGGEDVKARFSVRFGDVDVSFRMEKKRLFAEVGGKTVEVPGGGAGFAQQLENDVVSHVKFYGRAFVKREMARLEGTNRPPALLSARRARLATLKDDANQEARNWEHEQSGRLIGFYRNVLKSVLGDATYKQLALGSLPLSGLRMLANNALDGAYDSKRSATALVREVAEFGGRVQLSGETLIDLARAMDAREQADLGGKVKFAPIPPDEPRILSDEEEADLAEKHAQDMKATDLRGFIADALLSRTTLEAKMDPAQKFFHAASKHPEVFMALMKDSARTLALFTAEAAKDPLLGEVKDQFIALFAKIRETTAAAFMGTFSSEKIANAMKCFQTAAKYGVESPEFRQVQATEVGKYSYLDKLHFCSLVGNVDAPPSIVFKTLLDTVQRAPVQLSAKAMEFVEATAAQDLQTAEELKRNPPPKPLTRDEKNRLVAKMKQDADARAVHGFVADLVLGHDTVVEDVESRTLTPGRKFLKTLQCNVDGFVKLFNHTDEAIKLFTFETEIPGEGEARREPSPDSPTGQIRAALKQAFDGLVGGPNAPEGMRRFKMLSDDALKATMMCFADAVIHGVDSDEFKETLASARILLAAHPLDTLVFNEIFGKEGERPDAVAINMFAAAMEDVAVQLQATVNQTVDTAMTSLGAVMKNAVKDAFSLSEGDVAELLSDRVDANPRVPEFDAATAWKKSLKDYVGDSAISPKSGLGKFIMRSLITYFEHVDAIDKRNMVASLIRYTKQDSDAGEVLGALLKGAGPIMQKTLQGIPLNGLPASFAKALADMKDSLAPIDDHIVKVQLMNMIKESKGAIREITVKKSLGAASVGQAFLCEMTVPGPDGQDVKEMCVVKLLRPDVANRAQREKAFFRDVALHVPGMKQTFEGQLSTILDELDLTIEANNIKLGQVYHRNPDMRIESAQIHPLVRPTTDTLVMRLAPGQTIASAVKNCKARIAAIKAEIQVITRKENGTTSVKLSPTNRRRYCELRRELVELGRQMVKHNQMLVSLTSQWVSEAVFKEGFFHGDMHAGNIMSDGRTLTVIDFGNATKLTPAEQANLLRVVCACSAHNLDAFIEGFLGLLSDEGASAFKRNLGALRPQIASILSKGKAGDSGDRIMAVIMLLQQSGIEIPSQINKFAQSMLRLSDSVTQTQNAVDEIKGFLAQIYYPDMPLQDGRWSVLDVEGSLRTRLMDSGTDGSLQGCLDVLERTATSFSKEFKGLLTGDKFLRRTDPVYDRDGNLVFGEVSGFRLQETKSQEVPFDEGVVEVVDELCRGSRPEVVEGGEPVDHAQRIRGELDRFLQVLDGVKRRLGGLVLEGDDGPVLPPGGNFYNVCRQVTTRINDLERDLTNKKSLTKLERGALQAELTKLKGRQVQLQGAMDALTDAGAGLVTEAAALFRMKCGGLCDELKAGMASEIGDPSGFEESFEACASSNVKSAVGKIGMLQGLKLANQAEKVHDAEQIVELQVSGRDELFKAQLEGGGFESGTENYASVMTGIVRKALNETVQRVTGPAGFKTLFENRDWQTSDQGRSAVFELLTHNLKMLHAAMVGSCGLSEVDMDNGHPGRDQGAKYEAALRRVRIAGVFLFMLDGNERFPGVMQGILESLRCESRERYGELLAQFDAWVGTRPAPCGKAEAQLFRDLLMVASRGFSDDNGPIFAEDLFRTEYGKNMLLADAWTARTVYGQDERDEMDKLSAKGENDKLLSAKADAEQAIEEAGAPRDVGSREWADVFSARQAYVRSLVEYNHADVHYRNFSFQIERFQLQMAQSSEEDVPVLQEKINLQTRRRADYQPTFESRRTAFLQAQAKLDGCVDKALERTAVELAEQLEQAMKPQVGVPLDDVSRLRAASADLPPVSGEQIKTLKDAIKNSGMRFSRGTIDKLVAMLPFLSADARLMLNMSSRDLGVNWRAKSEIENFGDKVLAMLLKVGTSFMALEQLDPLPNDKKKGLQPRTNFERFEEARLENGVPGMFVSAEAQDIFDDFAVGDRVDKASLNRMRNPVFSLEDRKIGEGKVLAQIRQELLVDSGVPEGQSVLEKMLAASDGMTLEQLFDAAGIEQPLRAFATKIIENLPAHLKDDLAEGGDLAIAALKDVRGIMKEFDFDSMVEGAAKFDIREFAERIGVDAKVDKGRIVAQQYDEDIRKRAQEKTIGLNPGPITETVLPIFREIFTDGTDSRNVFLNVDRFQKTQERTLIAKLRAIRQEGEVPTQEDVDAVALEMVRGSLQALKQLHDAIDALPDFSPDEKSQMRFLADRFGYKSIPAMKEMVKELRTANLVGTLRGLEGASEAERIYILQDAGARLYAILQNGVQASVAPGFEEGDVNIGDNGMLPLLYVAFRLSGADGEALKREVAALFDATTLRVGNHLHAALDKVVTANQARQDGIVDQASPEYAAAGVRTAVSQQNMLRMSKVMDTLQQFSGFLATGKYEGGSPVFDPDAFLNAFTPGPGGTKTVLDALIATGEMPAVPDLNALKALFNLRRDGRFSTAVADTHGQVYLDANYEIQTVNRHSNRLDGVPNDPAQRRRNLTLRRQVRLALEKAGVSKAFLERADVRRLLGTDERGVVNSFEPMQRADLKRLIQLSLEVVPDDNV